MGWGTQSESWHDVALICTNGHVVNAASIDFPNGNKKHCTQCGAPTIDKCGNCGEKIQGEYHVPGVVRLGVRARQVAPAFCHGCGAGYPWTQARIQATIELLDLVQGLKDDEKTALSRSITDLTSETPRTQVAATRWKLFLHGTGKQVADAARSILVAIASETARKTIWGP
jgi:hypothetical protein